MSNFPLRYTISWLPRFLIPAVSDPALLAYPTAAVRLPDVVEKVRLAFVGDLSAVANEIPPSVDDDLRSLLSSADLLIGNCESPVVRSPQFRLGTAIGTRHAMTPEFVRGLLDAMGAEPARTVLSVANNHMLDQGVEGFEETLHHLDRLGLRTVGAARDDGHIDATVNEVSIRFLAFTRWRNASAADFAGRVITVETGDQLASFLRGRQNQSADLVCALPHWDWEFRQMPRPETRGWAHILTQSGCGLIVGSHAHIVQPVGESPQALIAYGLGDFVGTAWSRVRLPLDIGAVLLVDISAEPDTKGQIARWERVPVRRTRQARNERLALVRT